MSAIPLAIGFANAALLMGISVYGDRHLLLPAWRRLWQNDTAPVFAGSRAVWRPLMMSAPNVACRCATRARSQDKDYDCARLERLLEGAPTNFSVSWDVAYHVSNLLIENRDISWADIQSEMAVLESAANERASHR